MSRKCWNSCDPPLPEQMGKDKILTLSIIVRIKTGGWMNVGETRSVRVKTFENYYFSKSIGRSSADSNRLDDTWSSFESAVKFSLEGNDDENANFSSHIYISTKKFSFLHFPFMVKTPSCPLYTVPPAPFMSRISWYRRSELCVSLVEVVFLLKNDHLHIHYIFALKG